MNRKNKNSWKLSNTLLNDNCIKSQQLNIKHCPPKQTGIIKASAEVKEIQIIAKIQKKSIKSVDYQKTLTKLTNFQPN